MEEEDGSSSDSSSEDTSDTTLVDTEDEKEEHYGREKEGGSFKCSECEETFTFLGNLLRHERIKHEEPEWILCPIQKCKFRNLRMDYVRRHLILCHELDPSVVLPKAKSLPEGVGPGQRFKCLFKHCTATNKRKDHLYRHIRLIHKADPRVVMKDLFGKRPGKTGNLQSTAGNLFKCMHLGCERRFESSGGLREHVRKEHGEDKAESDSGEEEAEEVKRKKKYTDKRRSKTTYRSVEEEEGKETEEGDEEMETDEEEEGKEIDEGDEEEEGKEIDEGDEEEEGTETDEREEGEEMELHPDLNMMVITSLTEEEVADLKQDDEKELKEMCVLCCFSFQPSPCSVHPEKMDLSEDFHLIKFISEMLPNEDCLERFRDVAICNECRLLIHSAMDRKLEVDEVEFRLSKLEDKHSSEMRGLQEKLIEYCLEMMKIGDEVEGGDVSGLEAHLKRLEGQNDVQLVLLLRTRIISAIEKLKIRILEMEAHLSSLPPSMDQSQGLEGVPLHKSPETRSSNATVNVNDKDAIRRQFGHRTVEIKLIRLEDDDRPLEAALS